MTDTRNGSLGSVGRFFFSPTDPTALGFIRLLTGLIVLYTHAAYAFDLTAFFGPDGWWNKDSANRQRREAPTLIRSLGWEPFEPSVRFEDVAHRRAAQFEFFRNVPYSPAERAQKLRFLKTVYSKPHDQAQAGIRLVNSALRLTGDEAEQKRLSKALDSNPFDATDAPISYFPEFVKSQTPAERKAFWVEVQDFLTLLPQDGDAAELVLTWLDALADNQSPIFRNEKVVAIGQRAMTRGEDLYEFLIGEKKDMDGTDVSLPADKTSREEFIRYAELWSLDPRQATHKGTPVFSMWLHLTDTTTIWCVYVATMVVFGLFTIGLWTRVTSVLTWALTLCYLHRSALTVFGQDTMQTILLTYLMIGPCGAAFSVDALRARYRASRSLMGSPGRSVPWAEAVLAGPRPDPLANFAVRLLQIHFCFIYMSSGLSKLKGATWWSHIAGWMTMANPEFGLIRYPAYEWALRQLNDSRLGMAIVCAGITFFTLAVELGFSFLVWTRLRPVAVIGSMLLHTAIAIMMGLQVFSLYMYTLLMCYFPSKLIRDRVGVTPGSGRKFHVHYDPNDPASVRKAALIRSFDVAGQGTYVGDAHGAVRMVIANGESLPGTSLFTSAMDTLALLRPVRFFFGIPGVREISTMLFGVSFHTNPIGEQCPTCGSADHRTVLPNYLLTSTHDRVCLSCQTRYSRPTSMGAAAVMIAAGLILAAICGFAAYLRLGGFGFWQIPALVFEIACGYVGLVAILRGVAAILRPGKV